MLPIPAIGPMDARRKIFFGPLVGEYPISRAKSWLYGELFSLPKENWRFTLQLRKDLIWNRRNGKVATDKL